MRVEEIIPLHSIEAEMGVLGSMLLSSRAADQAVNIVTEEDFYRPAHKLIFRAMLQLLRQNKAIDFLTLKEELVARGDLADSGGENYLLQVAEFVPSPANVDYYAGIVVDRARLRQLEEAGRAIVGIVHDTEIDTADDKVDRAEQLVFEVGRRGLGNYFKPVSALAREFFIDVDKVFETRKPLSGLKVGFFDLDDLTTGFNPGDLVIVGARPAMGKTSLVLDFALNVAKALEREQKRGSVAFFSLEMSGVQLAQRMVAMLSGLSMRILRQDRELTDQDYYRLSEACDDLYSLPIYIDDNADLSPLEMRGKCRRLKAEHGLSLVIVDYLQLMRGSKKTDNRVNEISEIARSCKRMAKELEVPVIALSQLSRSVEQREDKRPQLSDLRESGSIEAEADMVLFLHRKSYYEAKAEKRKEVDDPNEVQVADVIVAKNRNGPTKTVKLGFQPAYSRYRNLAEGYGDDDE